MWPISSSILNIPSSHRVDLNHLVKIAIVPGPSPPSNMNYIVEHVFEILNNINKSGGVTFLNSKGNLSRCAVGVLSSVYDLPAMGKFTNLPCGLKMYGCPKCTVRGKSILDRVVYPPNIFGEPRSKAHIVAAIKSNSEYPGIEDMDTEGIRTKTMPAILRFTKVISVQLDAMHIILNIGNKGHDLLSGKRMAKLSKKKLILNVNPEIAQEHQQRQNLRLQQQQEAQNRYAQFALTNEEKAECDSRYKQMIITSDCMLLSICLIIFNFLLDTNRHRTPFTDKGAWNVNDMLNWSRGVGIAFLYMTTLSRKHILFFKHLYRVLRLISLPYTTKTLIETVKQLCSELSELIVELLPETEHTVYMHLLGHIAQGMELWGPPRSYWLFCFERLCRYFREHIKTHKYPESSAHLNISLELHGWSLCTNSERSHLVQYANTSADKKIISMLQNWYLQKKKSEGIFIKGKMKTYMLLEDEQFEITQLLQKSIFMNQNFHEFPNNEVAARLVNIKQECSKLYELT